MSHKLATPMRGAATQLTMRLGNGGGGTRRGGFHGTRLGAGWKKGIIPKGPGGGGGMMGGGGGPRDVSRRAADGDGEEPPAPKAAEAAGLWAAYGSVGEGPLLIKGLTSMTGFAIGDILAPVHREEGQVQPSTEPLNGVLRVAGPRHDVTLVLRQARREDPGHGRRRRRSKVFTHQVLWNPIFGVMFFGYMGLWERQGVDGTIKKIKGDLMTQVTGSWTVWPVAHAINFKFIPTERASSTSTRSAPSQLLPLDHRQPRRQEEGPQVGSLPEDMPPIHTRSSCRRSARPRSVVFPLQARAAPARSWAARRPCSP